jgi:hypothetical protein
MIITRAVLAAALALGLLAGPLVGEAQQATKISRIGYLSVRPGAEARDEAFRQGLRELGYVEGKNIVLEQTAGSHALAAAAQRSVRRTEERSRD